MSQRSARGEIGLHSEIRSFGDLLAGVHFFVIPYLQRPYEWGTAEVGDMVGDLLAACEGGYRNYFLGHIVGVRDDAGRIEIVDGQQRFTTTTILLAYIRDRVSSRNPELSRALQACIADGVQPRMTPRPSDAGFFLEWVQTAGRMDALTKSWKDEPAPFQTTTDAQALIVQAACGVKDKLDRLGHEAIDKFAWFVLDRAVVDFIIADNRTLASVLYRGMNMRGKQLSPADLIKLEAIETTGLSPQVREEAARTWERVEDSLGRERFSFLLEIMPLLVSREPTKRPGDLVEWRNNTFADDMDPETLLTQLLPVYGDVYEEILQGDIRATPRDRAEQQALDTVNRLVRGMLFLEDQHWVAPAIGAIHAHRERPHFLAWYFRGLDRLAFAAFLDAVRHEDRPARFASVVRAGANETLLSHAFELKKDEASSMLRRLGEAFKRGGWRRRAIAVRINSAFPGGYAPLPSEDVTLEHMLPSSHCPTWEKAGFSQKATAACANLIGNYVLVTYAQNNAAGQKAWAAKKDIYFDWMGGAPVHPITEDVRRQTEWTERHLRARTERLTAMLAADWDLA
jgi:hypothetical protein